MSILTPVGSFSFLAAPSVQSSGHQGGGVHHPLFPFAFNQSTAFVHPSNGLSQEDADDIQSRQLEQLRELESRMENLHEQSTPAPINSRRDRFNARRVQELQRQQLQQLQLQMHQQQQQQKHQQEQEDLQDKSSNVTSAVQGPIATPLNGADVPVLPFLTYPVIQNGTLVQIPILWTAMSLAMGVEIRGDVIRGLPCIKRLNQLFCPTAGTRYPGDPIERFIDENKALIRRMYGEFQTPAPATSGTSGTGGGSSASRRSVKREIDALPPMPRKRDAEFFFDDLDADYASVFESLGGNRTRRQANRQNNQNSNKSDACESTVEVVTPYWAANSSGKIRAIVNTQHFEQAVHQEVCSKPRTARCGGDCSCEQKYKWHRLLAYDPDNDCKGIFMDWFLFPSCCVCRCLPLN